jgi:methylmalonyl-CoA mutase C-terminal domain/subunit
MGSAVDRLARQTPRVLIAKTSLDGHWRGVAIVSTALRDAGFEVILGGMLRASEIAQTAVDEDVDLIGLNVGGRIEVLERILDSLTEAGRGDVPVFVGGTIAPQVIPQLEARGISVHPPGTSLDQIVDAARRLCGVGRPDIADAQRTTIL